MANSYDIHEHSHRFAACAAATGTSASPRFRFMVVAGKKILEMAGFDARLQHHQQLPSPTELDSADLNWRWKVIREAKKQGLEFTHGIAAKLINLYLMARFTSRATPTIRTSRRCIHPSTRCSLKPSTGPDRPKTA